MTTQDAIAAECDALKALLLEKNRNYGDSALRPVRVFSRADAVEQLLVRIDDKLSRVSRGAGFAAADEDTVLDLLGYFVLLKIAMRRPPAVASPDVPTLAFAAQAERRDAIPLFNCPSCGSEAEVKHQGEAYWVACKKRGCRSMTLLADNREAAVQNWNDAAAKARNEAAAKASQATAANPASPAVPAACPCGRAPAAFSNVHGRWWLTCPCGRSTSTRLARSEAVAAWNETVQG